MEVHCINLEDKDFINLSKKLNISPANLEDIIHKYLYDNDTDKYPSDDYIKAALEGTRTEMSQSQVDLWERDYSLPKRFKTLQELNKAKLIALQFFRKEAISEYIDAEGNYILKVTPPSFEKEYLEILAKAPRDSEGRLLAPNGKPSNLTERQYALVRSKAFKKWFGDWENANKENPYSKDISIGSPEADFSNVDGAGTGVLIPIFLNGKYIGETGLDNALYHKDKGMSIKGKYMEMPSVGGSNITIEKEYRGKGYGKATYFELAKLAANNGKILRSAPDKSRTPASTRVWESLVRDGYAKKINDRYEIINSALNDASKVVDENGEPLVVYHYTDNENLTKFSTEFDNYFARTGGTKNAIFFTTDNVVPGTEDNFLTSRKTKLSLFLNIKNLEIFHGTKDDLHKQGTSYREVVNKSSEREGSENGVVFTGFDDNRKENQTIYIVHNSNQIKSAESNIGTFSTTNDRIDDSVSEELFNNASNNNNDPQRFANILESELTISSEKTILSNEELKYWNELGVGEMPRILVASERTDPAFHVKDILDIINGEKTVPQWGVVNGRRAVTGNLSGKDFAGLYLITKHDGLPMLKLLLTKIPKLLHFSITTLGGTLWEPGVMKYNDLLDKIEDYIKLGLDPNSVTIRIDPIVPGITKKEDIELVVKRASSMGIKRIRFSIMDAYSNTRVAMTNLGYDFSTYYGKNFFANKEYIEDISNFMLSLANKYDITLGTCAENIAKNGISKEGCLSVAAVNNMLGTNIEDKGTDNNSLRLLCSCYGGKVDALAYVKTCASHCVYCYAKHENDKALQYYNEDGTLKDNVYTRTRENLLQSSQEEKKEINPLTVSDKTLQQLKERDPFEERLREINKLLDTLQESSLMTNTEIREIAELVVYWISDHITELLENPELAVKIYGDSVKNLDTQTASRIEIVNAIGLDNLKEMCRLKFSPKNAGYKKISTIKKASLIVSNWDAIILLASDVFTEIEKFSITETVVADKVVSLTNENLNNNLDNFDVNEQNDEESIQEAHGNLLEHWQTKANTIDIMDSMSLLMHRAIMLCYQLKEVGRDENNKPIYDKVRSEFGINLRVKPREATSSLLRWCQGCLNIKDVIVKLKEKEVTNPWVSLIITKLEDESGNESDFQSLFFGVFVKPFMIYGIVKTNENGDYISQIVNKNPALKEAVKGITTLYKIGEHPMFMLSGAVNKQTFRQFSLAMLELANLDLEKDKDTIVRNLGYMYNTLGFSVDDTLVKQVLNEDTYKMLKTLFGYIHKSLYDHLDMTNPKEYEPFKFKGNGSFLGTLNKVLQPITDILEDTAISSFYDNGNMYLSYVIPSYMTKLMSKFHKDGKEFDDFITSEYGKYGWFKDSSSRGIERGWKLPILKELVNSPEARKIFEHKVLLTFNKHQYMKKMDDVEYTLAILTEYWAETNRSSKGATRVPAWFRVPMMSNKPSAEYIKFYSERGFDYLNTITENIYKIFLLEMGRIQTVIIRNYDKADPEFIKNFDKNGKKFNFVSFMNEYLSGNKKNSELGKLILAKLNGDKINPNLELLFETLAKEAINEAMTERAEKIVNDFERKGIFDGAKKIEGINKDNIREELINFAWNDYYMSMNILLLTITDIAYYKDAEDLLKRLALIHAPGVRANRYATDYKGNPITDGKMRTFYLRDFDSFVSNIIDNVSVVFDRKIANAKTDLEKLGYLVLKDSIIELFKKINVADAQGYSSPTSYRKKALLFGKWSKEAEDIYQKLITGNYTYSDLKTAFLPLKPFVYTLIEKSSNVSLNEATMLNLKVPILNKNSEYLLIMADAMLLGENTGKPNLLRAIYSIMEQSSIEEKEVTLNNGKKQIIRTPRTNGIDTVLFESTVKSGLRGAIDINQFLYADKGEKQAKEYIESLIGNNGAYNETYVDEIPVEDYCLQLEVPGHFRNHELTHGSLIRAITPSDLESVDALGNTVTYDVEGKKLTAELFKDEYQLTIADNIEESIELLTEELKLGPEATLLDKNKALEKIFRREILSSPRYGVDLLLACSLNENGEFRIPKGDPIQSKRIELLLNSIIKNRVNKQEIAGGPVVQVSNFGTSKELNIRFKSKDGGLLMTREEFSKSPLAKKTTSTSQVDKFNARYKGKSNTMTYEDYIKEYQAGIAYFEVFAPIYLNDVFEKFLNPDGSIDMKAIEELNPDLLKMIGYRIPTEDKYSCAPLKIVGFLPREAGDAIMLPNDITLLTGSDFDIDKEYLMRKDIPITLSDKKDIHNDIIAELTKNKTLSKEKVKELNDSIRRFLDNPDPKLLDFKLAEDRVLWKLYKKFAYKAEAPTEGRTYRNNKIVDMTYEVLTHETVTDKILNPGGFDTQKRMGYLVSAYRNPANNYSWEELEAISKLPDGIDKLKELCYTEKNLCFIDTHIQFYKLNNAAGSLIGTFAVHKTAHAILESDGFLIDVESISEPFVIDGMLFGFNMTVDPRYDRKGNLIGKTLGSLVASAADAVKDPILNLMNINSNTSNILNTLIRLGMDFDTAALFLSLTAITRILELHTKLNITKYTSLNKVINDRCKLLELDYSIDDNLLTREGITREELINGLNPDIDNIDPKTEYRILKAFSNILNISSAMKSLTLVTRFNSMSSAVGPLIIDNLITEHLIENFSEKILYAGETCGIEKVYLLHPLLREFSRTLDIAKELMGNMPANSNGFRYLLNASSSYKETFYGDRKLLSQLSDFYQSYCLIASGAIKNSELKNYIEGFPTYFLKLNYLELYKDNALINAIKVDTTTGGRAILKIDTTGLDLKAKDVLSMAWIDLHRKDPDLSTRLFVYNFFRGGIGFNPKTFMQLVPTYVKEKLSKYVDTYRNLPLVTNALVLDQFIRNNWSNEKLVPTKKVGLKAYDSDPNTFMVLGEESTKEMQNVLYFKTKDSNGNYTIWRQKYSSEVVVTYLKVSPLGNNGEYLEMSTSNIKESLSDKQAKELFEAIDNGITENPVLETVEPILYTNEQLEDILYRAMETSSGVNNRELAQEKINQYRNFSEDKLKKYEKSMRNFLNNALNKLNIKVEEDLVNKVYNKLCK